MSSTTAQWPGYKVSLICFRVAILNFVQGMKWLSGFKLIMRKTSPIILEMIKGYVKSPFVLWTLFLLS